MDDYSELYFHTDLSDEKVTLTKKQRIEQMKINAMKQASKYRIEAIVNAHTHLRKILKFTNRIKKFVTKTSVIKSDSETENPFPRSTVTNRLPSVFDKPFLNNEFEESGDSIDNEPEDIQKAKEQEIKNFQLNIYNQACINLNVPYVSAYRRQINNKIMDLSYCSIDSEKFKPCAISLMSNTNIEEINLSDNRICDIGCYYLSNSLKENVSLRVLIFSNNSIKTEGLRYLCQSLKYNTLITDLDISGNNFYEKDLNYLVDLFSYNRTLVYLKLSNNRISIKGGLLIAKIIAVKSSLEILDLSWNNIRLEGATSICKSLGKNSSLKELNLGWNGIFLSGCIYLSQSLRQNQTLVHLNISNNRLNMECIGHIFKGIEQNNTLEILNIDNNPITIIGIEFILKCVKESVNQSLTKIDFKSHSISEAILKTILEISNKQNIKFDHGKVYWNCKPKSNETRYVDEYALLDSEPLMVLLEYVRLSGLRLLDFFSSLDKDGSKSLTTEEFTEGIKSIDIPLSQVGISRLIKKLDVDGDGEVDYSELLEGQKEHKIKYRKMMELSKSIPIEMTEIGRICAKLAYVMKNRNYKRIARINSYYDINSSITHTTAKIKQLNNIINY
ncbi:Ribonuclease/angiogenin inhibitor 1 [Intoshia linei]|uniref:Ribonuclease/angiogenin inhibitor 1 n=1 Tax=Intoshia linei TaxID=1819745 RepID=A0A177B601_9BILA|nr:Ribonuclease/angiogenin inhibitor 1 [Intoshia linei]